MLREASKWTFRITGKQYFIKEQSIFFMLFKIKYLANELIFSLIFVSLPLVSCTKMTAITPHICGIQTLMPSGLKTYSNE